MTIGYDLLAIGLGLLCGALLTLILRRRHRLWHGHALLWGVVLGAFVTGAVYAVRFVAAGRLLNEDIAFEVQAAAAVLSFIASIILTGITILYAGETRAMARTAERTAKTTEEAALAAMRSADVAERQQRSSTRPVLVFRLRPADGAAGGPRAHAFQIDVMNVGLGPALETRVEITGPLRYLAAALPVQPFVTPRDQSDRLEFRLNVKQPFTDPALPGWPRSRDQPEPADEPLMDEAPASTGERVLRQQRLAFLNEMARSIDGLGSVGILRATYRDIAGDSYITTATIAAAAESKTRTRGHGQTGAWHDHLHRHLSLEAIDWGRDASGAVAPDHAP